jgi:hypothetical protein
MTVRINRTLDLTTHAISRISARRLGQGAVDAAMLYGRCVHTRGAEIYAIGRQEVERARMQGVNLASYEGIHVVCDKGVVLTAYRNRDLRGLRTGGKPCRVKTWSRSMAG